MLAQRTALADSHLVKHEARMSAVTSRPMRRQHLLLLSQRLLISDSLMQYLTDVDRQVADYVYFSVGEFLSILFSFKVV